MHALRIYAIVCVYVDAYECDSNTNRRYAYRMNMRPLAQPLENSIPNLIDDVYRETLFVFFIEIHARICAIAFGRGACVYAYILYTTQHDLSTDRRLRLFGCPRIYGTQIDVAFFILFTKKNKKKTPRNHG